MRKFQFISLTILPAAMLAGCGGEQPQPSMMQSPDTLLAPGAVGTGPVRGNASKKQPDLGVDASFNGFRPFNDASLWNHGVDKDALDPNSDKTIAKMGADKTTLNIGFGAMDKNKQPFGTPYTVVAGNAPRNAISFSTKGLTDQQYPFPANMPIEPSAKVAIAIDRDGLKLYEASGVDPDGTGYKATAGYTWDLRDTGENKPDIITAEPSGIPIFPGLVRYDEIYPQSQSSSQAITGVQSPGYSPLPSSGPQDINHALRFTMATVKKTFVYPATGSDGTSDDADVPQMGIRLRLKKSYDTSKFPATAQIVMKALKKYGMVLSAVGPDATLAGAPSAQWIDADLATLKKLTMADFEVVKAPDPPKPPKGKQAPKTITGATSTTPAPTTPPVPSTSGSSSTTTTTGAGTGTSTTSASSS